MNLFDSILIDVILLVFPLLCYIIYMFFAKTFDKKEKNLFFTFAVLTSSYFVIKYGVIEYKKMPLAFLDILLIVSYLYKDKLSIILLSLAIGTFYYFQFNLNIIMLIIEYLFYFILFLISERYTKKGFIEAILVFKIFVFYNWYYFYILKSQTVIEYGYFFISITLFYIIIRILVSLFKKALSICSLYKSVENIEKDKEAKESLFKITHEIKNPIAVVKGYLDMFDVENKDHPKRFIPIIKEEINRVLTLLEDFLSISRIKIKKEEMDLSLLYEDIIDNLTLVLRHKNIELEYKEMDEIYILADYDRLKQVFVNILKNSMESIIDEGKIIIDYEIVKDNIKLKIKDNGIGMTKDELKSLKEAFYTTKKNGTGLGVYLSNDIIEKHHGKLEYRSTKNKGTTVTITLPYKKDIKIS